MRTDINRKKIDLQIGRHHFALFRGTLDGLPLDVLGDRYLETGDELRRAKRILDWVRSELIIAARRYHHETGVTGASFTRLLRLKPEVLKPEERIALEEVPTLEEFQAEHDPSGFYSETELIEEFQKRYESPEAGLTASALRKASQNARLRKRLRHAIDVLENWIAKTPKPTDPIAIWLDPIIVTPLSQYGVISIEDLAGLINRRGNLWHRKIPGFGTVRARRVISWLQINQVLPLNELALQPYQQIVSLLPSLRPPETGLVPLEHLKLGVDLDGSLGTNRHPAPQLSAKNDREAIESWIQVKARNPNTVRAYRSQAERFLLWCVFEKGRALSSATIEDCAEYLDFLKALGNPKLPWPWTLERTRWIAPKGVKRWHPDWKPFTGEMTDSSIRQAMIIVKALFAYLARTRYIDYDPWTELDTPPKQGKELAIEHVLNDRQWQAIQDTLAEMHRDEPWYRLRWIVNGLCSTGLRSFEFIGLTANNLMRNPTTGTWKLRVTGKRNKQREIPLLPEIMEQLCDYMEVRTNNRNPYHWPPGIPLVTALGPGYQDAQKNPNQPLAERTLHQILKSLFTLAAQRLDDMIDADTLEQASAHWCRHTFVTEAIAAGAPIDAVQQLAGHADSRTTSLYTHASEKRQVEAMEVLSGRFGTPRV